MTSRSDGSLLEEINYLTGTENGIIIRLNMDCVLSKMADLIQSHQEAPKCINKSRRKAQYKWKPATK